MSTKGLKTPPHKVGAQKSNWAFSLPGRFAILKKNIKIKLSREAGAVKHSCALLFIEGIDRWTCDLQQNQSVKLHLPSKVINPTFTT